MGLEITFSDGGFHHRVTLGNEHHWKETRYPAASAGPKVLYQQVREARLDDPWPGISLNVAGVEGALRFHPRKVHQLFQFEPSDRSFAQFEAVALQLVERIAEHGGAEVDRGWNAVPDVPWEEVHELPEFSEHKERAGYRSHQLRVLARRNPPSPFHTLLLWLASSPDKPWRQTTRELVMTEHQIYQTQYDGDLKRLPLDALRKRLGPSDGDAVYVFGRKSFLLLPHAKGCEVQAELERRLLQGR